MSHLIASVFLHQFGSSPYLMYIIGSQCLWLHPPLNIIHTHADTWQRSLKLEEGFGGQPEHWRGFAGGDWGIVASYPFKESESTRISLYDFAIH